MASSLLDRVWTKDGLKVVLKGPGIKRSGKKFSLARPFARIGRFPYLDLPIDDPEVSRWHVYLQRFPEGVFFVDLGSRLGLIHRGVACRDGWLEPGAPLEIGDYSLVVTEPGGAEGAGGAVGAASAARANPLARIDADKDDLLPVTLTFLTRDGNSIDHRLKRRLTLMGRSKPSNVRIADPSIARAHLAFYRTRTEAWIVNLAAASAFHDGQPLTSARLADEDAFLVGDLTIVARVGSRATEQVSSGSTGSRNRQASAAADSGALLLDALEPTELEEGLATGENTWDSDPAAPNGSLDANGHEDGIIVESAHLDARGIEEFFAEPRIVVGPPEIQLARLEPDSDECEQAFSPLSEPAAALRVLADESIDAPLPGLNGHGGGGAGAGAAPAIPAKTEPVAKASDENEERERESTRLIEENLRLLEQQSESQKELAAANAKLNEVEQALREREARLEELTRALRDAGEDKEKEYKARSQADERVARQGDELQSARDRLAQVEMETVELKRLLTEQSVRLDEAAARLAERDGLIVKMRGNQFKAAALIRQRNRLIEQLRGELTQGTQDRDELAAICREWKEAAQAGHERERELAEAARVSAAALADLQARLLTRDEECLAYQAELSLLKREQETVASASASARIEELERLFGETMRRGEQEHRRLIEDLAASQAELAAMSREVSSLTRALRESAPDSGAPGALGSESSSAPASSSATESPPAPPTPPAPREPEAVHHQAPLAEASASMAEGPTSHGSTSPGAPGAGSPAAAAESSAGESAAGAANRPAASKVAATLLDRAEGINQARQSLINVGWIALSLVSLITLTFGLFWILLP